MKYIIDIPFETDFIVAVRMVDGLPVEVKAEKQEELEPYTEPNHKAIEIQHAHDIENVARLNYHKGAEDAWEFAKQVSIMKPEDKEECWGTAKYNTINLGYSYQEAKAKYDAWKTEKESKIEVGDEVMHKITKSIGIATWVDPEANYVHIVWSDGSTGNRKMDSLEKTGRHFNQVADLFKAMKGENDDTEKSNSMDKEF